MSPILIRSVKVQCIGAYSVQLVSSCVFLSACDFMVGLMVFFSYGLQYKQIENNSVQLSATSGLFSSFWMSAHFAQDHCSRGHCVMNIPGMVWVADVVIMACDCQCLRF